MHQGNHRQHLQPGAPDRQSGSSRGTRDAGGTRGKAYTVAYIWIVHPVLSACCPDLWVGQSKRLTLGPFCGETSQYRGDQSGRDSPIPSSISAVSAVHAAPVSTARSTLGRGIPSVPRHLQSSAKINFHVTGSNKRHIHPYHPSYQGTYPYRPYPSYRDTSPFPFHPSHHPSYRDTHRNSSAGPKREHHRDRI